MNTKKERPLRGKLGSAAPASKFDFVVSLRMDTGKAVEEMLEASKLTKSQLARALGVSVTGVEYMLSNPSMSLKRLYQIAEVAGFKVDITLTKIEKEHVIVL